MSTDISSPLTTNISRADRYDGVIERLEYKFKLPNLGTAPNFPFMNGQIFKFELLQHVTAPNFLFMLKLPRPSLPYHHSAHRLVSLQLFQSGQICRHWRRLYASQQMHALTLFLVNEHACTIIEICCQESISQFLNISCFLK
jgi:hypothetical protein